MTTKGSSRHSCALDYQNDREITLDTAPMTYTVAEAARVLGISRALAYELVRRGELPSIRLGRRIVVPSAALTAVLEQRWVRPA